MIYSFLLYCLLTFVCVYLVDYYASKEVSPHVKVWSVITWVLNFGLAFLVPEDVYETLKGREGQPTSRLGLQYLLLYWLVYLLTWTVIPLLQEWEDAGDIQSSQRMKRSLRINGIFYLVLLGVAAVFLLVLVMLGAGKEMGLLLYLKCLAMIWGMFLLIILLGYSLVEIPRTMWRNAHPRQYLTYLYHRIYQMEVEVEQAKREFKQVTAYISHVSKHTQDQDILRYCHTSISLIPDSMQDIVNSNYQKVIASTGYLETYPICLESSIQHNRLMKRAIARVRRQVRGLHDYLLQAVFYEDIKLALDQGTELRSVARQTSKLQSMWYCRIRPTSDKVLACCIVCCCVVLLVSQTQVFLSDSSSILGYLLLFKNIQVLRVLVFLVMAFLIYMANYALFRLKLANLYGLYRKESDGASLMFATVNFSRISVAIVLNFFDMVKMEDSTYSHVMQVVEMGLLGEWVLKGLPGLLWLIVLSHYFNVWGWMAKKAGFEGSYAFLSHELETSSEGHPSKSLVSRKREELQEGRMETVFRELDNF